MSSAEKTERPNIILIAIDTLRASSMSCYGHNRPTSPVLDAHAAGGTRFSSAYPEAIPTQPSYTAMLSGTSPIVNNVVSHVLWKVAEDAAKDQSLNVLPGETWRDKMPKITPGVKLIGELMQGGGYKTYAVDNLVKMRSHFDRGYDEYVYSSEASGEDKRFAVTADDINYHAFPLLSRIKDETFFAFFHYWDPHAPYEPPEEFQNFMRETKDQTTMRRELVFDGADLSWEDFIFIAKAEKGSVSDESSAEEKVALLAELEARYDGEIAYIDNRLGRLFDHMRDLGLDKNTVVIVTADHGESFGNHNTIGHGGLHEPVIHVPLWFHGPGIPAGKTIDGFVRQADIVPTILDLAGVTPDLPYEFSGESLIPAMRGKANVTTEVVCCVECGGQKTRSIRMGKWKYIRAYQGIPRRDRLPERELYDLEADPKELDNLVEKHPDIADMMDDKLNEFIKQECGKVGRAEDVLISTPLPEDLKALEDPSKYAFSLKGRS